MTLVLTVISALRGRTLVPLLAQVSTRVFASDDAAADRGDLALVRLLERAD